MRGWRAASSASGAISVATVVGLLLLWFLVTHLGLIKPLFLPSPQAVFQQFYEYLTGTANDKPLWEHLVYSVLRVSVAFWLAFLTAVPVGIGMGMSRVVRDVMPIHAPRAEGSGWGQRSPVKYGRKIRPSEPSGARCAPAISNSYGSIFFFLARAISFCPSWLRNH